ncbi:M12 family metallopeptidase [Paludibacterium paludis]|uniref:Peptidase M12A domain-containing protein n=1 Tax=Paludibacterium paludis TaxID=1225769 RepID=A0A918U7Y9_9NEIS|nr:M12 family metallopeptidase [Paludibacterium paludis]GGY06707.1 hypothetical protein GCM10011289_06560 [Paludibacterium paludis]
MKTSSYVLSPRVLARLVVATAMPLAGAAFALTPDTSAHVGYDNLTGKEITYRVLPDGEALAYGDIRIGSHAQIQQHGIDTLNVYPQIDSPRKKRAVWRPSGTAWPDNIVYYEFDSDVDRQTWDAMLAAMRHMEERTAVRFVSDATQPYRLKIFAKPKRGVVCGTSFLGRLGPRSQPQALTISCPDISTSLHELMHALGFHHEEMRRGNESAPPDPDSVVRAIKQSSYRTLSAGDIAGIHRYYPFSPTTPARRPHPAYRPPEPGREHPVAPRSDVKAVYQLVSQRKKECLMAFGDGETVPWFYGASGVGTMACRTGMLQQQWRYRLDGRIQSVAYPAFCLGADGAGHVGRGRRGNVLKRCDSAASLRWSVSQARIIDHDAPDAMLQPVPGGVDAKEESLTDVPLSYWYWVEVSPDPASSVPPAAVPPSARVPVSPLAPPTVLPISLSGHSGAGRLTASPHDRPAAGLPLADHRLEYRPLISARDGQCLTAMAMLPSHGRRGGKERASLQPCRAGSEHQSWVRLPNGWIKNQRSPGLCLALTGIGAAPTRQVVVGACEARPLFQWQLTGNQLRNVTAPGTPLANSGAPAVPGIRAPGNTDPAWIGWRWGEPQRAADPRPAGSVGGTSAGTAPFRGLGLPK